MAADGAARPVDSVDGPRPPSLTTGPSTASGQSTAFMLDLIVPVSPRTNGCPEKPGAAQARQARPPPESKRREQPLLLPELPNRRTTLPALPSEAVRGCPWPSDLAARVELRSSHP